MPTESCLRLFLLNPSHYDDQGYVIQWWRALVPAQSLAVVDGILHAAATAGGLPPGVDLQTRSCDEIATPFSLPQTLSWLNAGERSALLLVGVQTNQYPRALDLARPFRTAGIPVLLGGFHVSGVLALLPEWEEGLQDARALGISLYAGELECGADRLLVDLWQGNLAPFYNYLDQQADLSTAPSPRLNEAALARTWRRMAGMDMGRGCPYNCSFCTIIHVHGRRPRYRSAEAVIAYLRLCVERGVRDFIISDDNFARNPNWEAILNGFKDLQEEKGAVLDLFLQVDLEASTIPGFVEKAVQAGCRRVFIGIESVRDDNLNAASKGINRQAEMAARVGCWKEAGVIVYAGYIIGLPHDTPERVRADIRLLQEEIPVDIPQFYMLTPLPGSALHRDLVRTGAALDPDFNRYDTEHAVMAHPRMSGAEWEALYREAWQLYYSPDHLYRLFCRARQTGTPVRELFKSLVMFPVTVAEEGVHPLQSGILRCRRRRQRRPVFPRESPWRFYPALFWHSLRVQVALLRFSLQSRLLLLRTQLQPAGTEKRGGAEG